MKYFSENKNRSTFAVSKDKKVIRLFRLIVVDLDFS
ncbi:Uncharacterised protein [Prevotella disiens]|uniref:Uncharacterized protein n=1 Tax=Prevotella disiens TaxID=28130 RepID=A0A379EFS0_9BACT|nr:Uncharacterised protein [Prevotella disiens]